MDKFNWTKEYSVKVEMLDEQHQHFLEIVNKVADFINNKESKKDVLTDIIHQLGNYAFYHLGTEEELFDKYGYSDKVSHVEAHNKFREMTMSYIDRIGKNDHTLEELDQLSEEVAEYAGNWLLKHILVMDKKYSEFFNIHGVK